MDREECLKCKKHHSQWGNCYLNKPNCLLYEEEARGKMVRADFSFNIDVRAETPLLKHGSKVKFDDRGKDIHMVIVKINSLNLERRICNITAEYHENERPFIESKKLFRLVN